MVNILFQLLKQLVKFLRNWDRLSVTDTRGPVNQRNGNKKIVILGSDNN